MHDSADGEEDGMYLLSVFKDIFLMFLFASGVMSKIKMCYHGTLK